MENEQFNLESKEMKDSDKKRNLQEKLKKIIFRRDSKSRKLSENLDDSTYIKNKQNIKYQKTEKQNDFSNNKDKGKINEKIIFFKNKNLLKEKDDLTNNKDHDEIKREKDNMLEEEKSDAISPFELNKNKNKRNNSLSNDSNKNEALKILQLLKKKKSEKEILEFKENEAKKEVFQNDINNEKYIPKISKYKYATSNLNKKKKKFIYENSINPEEKNGNIFNKNNEQIGLTKKNYFRNVINISFNKYYNSNNIELLKPNNDIKDEKIEKNFDYNNKDKDNHILNKNNSESKINNIIYTNKSLSNIYKKNNIIKRNVNNNLNAINISTKMFNDRNQNIIRSIDVNNDYYLSNNSKKVYTPKKTYIRLGKSKEKNIFHRKINKRNQIPIGIEFFTNVNSFNNVYYNKNNSPKKIINHSLGEKQFELNSPNTFYDNYNSIHSNFDIYENNSKINRNENKKINKTRVLIKNNLIHNKNKSQFTTKNLNKMNNIYNNYCSNNINNKKEIKINNTKYYNYIKKKIPNNSLDKKDKQNKNLQKKIMKLSKDKISFNIQYVEELLILDDKFNLIITKIDSAESKSISNECFDFLNYFYNSIIYLNFEQIMNDSENYEIINLFIKYVLLSIILCYDLSLDNDTINMHLKLSEILEINYKSFIIILEMIYDKIDIENKNNNDNFWINNLSNLISNWKYLNERN